MSEDLLIQLHRAAHDRDTKERALIGAAYDELRRFREVAPEWERELEYLRGRLSAFEDQGRDGETWKEGFVSLADAVEKRCPELYREFFPPMASGSQSP